MTLVWTEMARIPPEELDKVAGEREVWASLLRLLPPRPNPGYAVNNKRINVMVFVLPISEFGSYMKPFCNETIQPT